MFRVLTLSIVLFAFLNTLSFVHSKSSKKQLYATVEQYCGGHFEHFNKFGHVRFDFSKYYQSLKKIPKCGIWCFCSRLQEKCNHPNAKNDKDCVNSKCDECYSTKSVICPNCAAKAISKECDLAWCEKCHKVHRFRRSATFEGRKAKQSQGDVVSCQPCENVAYQSPCICPETTTCSGEQCDLTSAATG